MFLPLVSPTNRPPSLPLQCGQWVPVHHDHLQRVRVPRPVRPVPVLPRHPRAPLTLRASLEVPDRQVCHLPLILARWVTKLLVVFYL